MKYFFISDKLCKKYWYIIEGRKLAVDCGKHSNEVYYNFGYQHLICSSRPRGKFNQRTGPKFSPHTFDVIQYNELDDLMNTHFADML